MFLSSCNNEELYVTQIEEQIIEEEIPEEGEDEEAPEPVNEIFQIEIENDIIETNENVPVEIQIFANDNSLPTNLSISNTSPQNGTLEIVDNDTPNDFSDDSILYSPSPDYFGTDFFEYTICDTTSEIENCATARVDITINEVIVDDISTELKAFPTAHGAGRNATGGRGGVVLHVTSLADGTDSDVGTLRWALRQPYPRIIVFDVSGQINLDPTNYITLEGEHDNLTVAGQTAPEGGITISGNAIIYGGGYTATPQQPMNNHIWRYIRFRNASTAGTTRETGVILNNTSNWIFDHCSWSFCGNGALEMEGNAGDVLNGTVQKNIVSECGTGMILGNNDNGTWEIGNMTSMLNLWVDLSHRAPNIGGNFEQTGLQYDLINNLHYNWKSFTTNIKSPGKPRVNQIGNYFEPGDYSWSYNYNNSGNIDYHYIGACQADNDTKIYSADNYHTIKNPQDTGDTRYLWRAVGGNNSDPNNPFTTLNHSYFVNMPFSSLDPTYAIKTPTAARADILSDVGANKYLNADGTFGIYMDDFDSTKINNVINGISTSPYDEASYGSQLSAIVANMPRNTRPANYDTDRDGMPDAWEFVAFGDLSRDGTGDFDGDGYTDVEEFLNLVDRIN